MNVLGACLGPENVIDGNTMTDPQEASAGLRNTQVRFGAVAKTLHWLTAILILTMLGLGIVASKWPFDTSDALAMKGMLFSIHKTLGLTTFTVAVIRIGWAVVQPRPAPLPTSKIQHFAAETVHWSLYGALVLVPITGWMHHAATTGFAPILWPFGQTLFFVPQSVALAAVLGKLHLVFNIVLVASIFLHVAGALKHHVVDRDATLKRMLPGQVGLPLGIVKKPFHKGPLWVAVCIWVMAAGVGAMFGLVKSDSADAATSLEAVQSEWTVTEGTLTIAVDQFGQSVDGTFADWTAEISFSEVSGNGQHGNVTVVIAIPSLTLGSVTNEALAADFLDAQSFGTATYTGPILAQDNGFVVDGTLNLVGKDVPLQLPFVVSLEGDRANATGETVLDRRDFGIGEAYPDESSVGFGVGIRFNLLAMRGG